jgi:hypothetical protein
MKGNGDGGIDIGVVTVGEGWVMFRAGITPTTDLGRVPSLLNETMLTWAKANPTARVRSTLSIVENGNTVTIHVWFDC